MGLFEFFIIILLGMVFIATWIDDNTNEPPAWMILPIVFGIIYIILMTNDNSSTYQFLYNVKPYLYLLFNSITVIRIIYLCKVELHLIMLALIPLSLIGVFFI